jgi:hypothetical protein
MGLPLRAGAWRGGHPSPSLLLPGVRFRTGQGTPGFRGLNHGFTSRNSEAGAVPWRTFKTVAGIGFLKNLRFEKSARRGLVGRFLNECGIRQTASHGHTREELSHARDASLRHGGKVVLELRLLARRRALWLAASGFTGVFAPWMRLRPCRRPQGLPAIAGSRGSD